MSWAIKQNLNYLNVNGRFTRLCHEWGQIQTQCISFYYTESQMEMMVLQSFKFESFKSEFLDNLNSKYHLRFHFIHSTLKSTSHQRTKGNTFMDLLPDNTPFSCVYGSSTSRRAHRLLHNWRWWDARSLVMIGLKLVNLRANHKLEGVFVVWLRHFLTGRGILYVLTFPVLLLTGTSSY